MQGRATGKFDERNEEAFRISPKEVSLDSRLMEGKNAIVYVGQVKGISSTVAIKYLNPSLFKDKDARFRFKHELGMFLRLYGSSHVVTFYGFTDFGSEAYGLITEFTPYGSLKNHLLDLPRADEKVHSIIMNSAVQGLKYIHEQGIIHADVKPDNLLIMDGWVTKWCDFGGSILISSAHLNCRAMGTPIYMAPEVLIAGRLSIQSDIYSLVSVFWTMIAGHDPHLDMESKRELIDLVAAGGREEIPLPVTDKRYQLIHWGWEGVPEDRPTTTEILLELKDLGAPLMAKDRCRGNAELLNFESEMKASLAIVKSMKSNLKNLAKEIQTQLNSVDLQKMGLVLEKIKYFISSLTWLSQLTEHDETGQAIEDLLDGLLKNINQMFGKESRGISRDILKSFFWLTAQSVGLRNVLAQVDRQQQGFHVEKGYDDLLRVIKEINILRERLSGLLSFLSSRGAWRSARFFVSNDSKTTLGSIIEVVDAAEKALKWIERNWMDADSSIWKCDDGFITKTFYQLADFCLTDAENLPMWLNFYAEQIKDKLSEVAPASRLGFFGSLTKVFVIPSFFKEDSSFTPGKR